MSLASKWATQCNVPQPRRTREKEMTSCEQRREELVLLMNVPTLAGNCHACLLTCPACVSARLPAYLSVAAALPLKGSTNCRPFRMLYEQSVHLPVRKCCRLSCDEEEASFNTFYKLASNQFGNLRIGRRFNENREIRGPWNSLLTLQNMYNMVSIIGHQSYAQLPLACAKLILIWAISIGSAASSLALLLII